MNKIVDPADIENIKTISDLENFNLSHVLKWFRTVGIILEDTNLDFEDLISCDTKSKDPSLPIPRERVPRFGWGIPRFSKKRGIPREFPIFVPHSQGTSRR